MTHKCEFPQIPPDDPNVEGYGPAIEICEENDDGSLWVSNGEYASRVNFCPFCGYKARNQRNDLQRAQIG